MEYQGLSLISVLSKSIGGFLCLLVSFVNIQSASGDSIERAQKLTLAPVTLIASTSVAETADASAQLKSSNAGFKEMPIQTSSSAYSPENELAGKKDETIDMGRILDFTIADPLSDYKGYSKSGPLLMLRLGDTPNIIATSRAKRNDDWGRYQMDIMPVNTKGISSILSNGLIVSVRMAL